MLMNENRRCSILFHLLVPGGRWWIMMSMPSSVARPCNSRFHSRTREPLLPPPSAVITSRLAPGSRTWPISCHQRRIVCTAKAAVSWSIPTLTQPAWAARSEMPYGPAQFLDQEIMPPNFLRLALGVPLPTAVPEVADPFLLLCVHRDHRLLLGQRRGNALADVGERRIAIRVAAALPGLAVGLQAELLLLQQFADNRVADPVATRRHFPRQPPQALAGPAQRRHRIAPLARRHQREQVVQQGRVRRHQRLAPSARAANPVGVQPGSGGQLLQAPTDRAHRDASGPRHCGNPAIPSRTRFGRRKQSPSTLIQMRQEQSETRANAGRIDHPNTIRDRSTAENPSLRPATPIHLFPDGPLAGRVGQSGAAAASPSSRRRWIRQAAWSSALAAWSSALASCTGSSRSSAIRVA